MIKEIIARIKNPNAVRLGRLGGKARARKLSKEELSEIGRKGAEVTNRRYLDRKHGYRSYRDAHPQEKCLNQPNKPL